MKIKQHENVFKKSFSLLSNGTPGNCLVSCGPRKERLSPSVGDTLTTVMHCSRESALREEERLISIDHIRILGIGLELACNGGSCGGMSLKRD